MLPRGAWNEDARSRESAGCGRPDRRVRPTSHDAAAPRRPAVDRGRNRNSWKPDMKSLIAFSLTAVLVSGCAGMTPGAGGSLKVASWNLEHLAERDGDGCSPRKEADYADLRRHAAALGPM